MVSLNLWWEGCERCIDYAAAKRVWLMILMRKHRFSLKKCGFQPRGINFLSTRIFTRKRTGPQPVHFLTSEMRGTDTTRGRDRARGRHRHFSISRINEITEYSRKGYDSLERVRSAKRVWLMILMRKHYISQNRGIMMLLFGFCDVWGYNMWADEYSRKGCDSLERVRSSEEVNSEVVDDTTDVDVPSSPPVDPNLPSPPPSPSPLECGAFLKWSSSPVMVPLNIWWEGCERCIDYAAAKRVWLMILMRKHRLSFYISQNRGIMMLLFAFCNAYESTVHLRLIFR